MSKLLIPMKEAFVKIDLYASYSYRIEESFKAVAHNTLKSSFDQIKEYERSEENPINNFIDAIERIKT
jgi:ribosomal protein S7